MHPAGKAFVSESKFVEGEMYHLLKLNKVEFVGPSRETLQMSMNMMSATTAAEVDCHNHEILNLSHPIKLTLPLTTII